MASHSPREDLFQKHYDEIVSLLEAFVNSVVVSGDYLSAESSLIGYLIDMYSSVFLDEIDYILDALGVVLAPEEIIEIRNGVNTSAFARSNYGRLKEILDAHASDLRAKLIDSIDTISFDDIVKEFSSNLERLALSEVQMGIEKASVESAKLFELVTENSILKTWNCIGDANTCPTCLAMNGLTIPVTESFSAVAPSVGIVEQLSYTGGDIVYAHPRCRCWVTYSKA